MHLLAFQIFPGPFWVYFSFIRNVYSGPWRKMVRGLVLRIFRKGRQKISITQVVLVLLFLLLLSLNAYKCSLQNILLFLVHIRVMSIKRMLHCLKTETFGCIQYTFFFLIVHIPGRNANQEKCYTILQTETFSCGGITNTIVIFQFFLVNRKS